MTRPVVGLAVFGAIVLFVGVAILAIKGQVYSNEEVRIESVSPGSASVGTEVVIRGSGFDDEANDIGFTYPDSYTHSSMTIFQSNVPSSDGKTLVFELNETLGECAMSQLDSGVPCSMVGYSLPTGPTEIAVYNHNGTSNTVQFTRTISQFEAATTEIKGRSEYFAFDYASRWDSGSLC